MQLRFYYLRQGDNVFTSVRMSVCLLRRVLKNYSSNLYEILWNDWTNTGTNRLFFE